MEYICRYVPGYAMVECSEFRTVVLLLLVLLVTM
jgi:hypothetical protein